MIIAFIGDNGYAREQAAKEFISGFVNQYGDVAADRFIGDTLELNQLNDAVSTLPFLSPRRLVVVRDLGGNKVLAETIESTIANMAGTTDLVIVESQMDSRTKYFTTLNKIAEVREFTHLEGDALIKWIVTQAKILGGQIDYDIARELVERIGTNHQLIVNELQKLILYQQQITTATVKLLTSYAPQSSIFAMLDAAFAGDIARALKLYGEQRVQGMEPQAILGMIVWQLHALSLVKAAGNMPIQEMTNKSKLNPFVIRKNLNTAKRVSEKKLVSLFEQAINIDKKIKTTQINSDDAVQALIVAFA